MESPIKLYKDLKRINNIEYIAYEHLFENYLKLNLKGVEKLIDLDSTDKESVLNRLMAGLPFPGVIYTFIHLNEKNLNELQNLKTGKTVQFHDFTPILFCTSFSMKDRLIKGLNLNMLPQEERLKFLQAFYQKYESFFRKIEEKQDTDITGLINIKYLLSAITGKNAEIIKNFSKQQNAYFEYAYRSYNLQNTRRFRMIEYSEWQYIPFFDAQQSFKKINLEKIYQVYDENKNKTK